MADPTYRQAENFLIPQHARIVSEVYEREYADRPRLVYFDEEGPEWAEEIVQFTSNASGRIGRVTDQTNAVPRVRSRHTTQVEMAAIGYTYSEAELMQAMALGRDLRANAAMECNRIAQEAIYDLQLKGYPSRNWDGLINHANVPQMNAPNNSGGTSARWADKTPDEILADFITMMAQPLARTSGIEMMNEVFLPTDVITDLSMRRMTDGTTSVLQYLKEQNPYTLTNDGNSGAKPFRIRPIWELRDAATGNLGRAMAIKNNMDVVRFYIPKNFTFKEPFRSGPMTWDVDGEFRVGGLSFQRPRGAFYLDGISA